MFGSVEGYLVDKNGTYTFSYKEDEKLVVIKSKDMALMIGAMGKDWVWIHYNNFILMFL